MSLGHGRLERCGLTRPVTLERVTNGERKGREQTDDVKQLSMAGPPARQSCMLEALPVDHEKPILGLENRWTRKIRDVDTIADSSHPERR